MKTAENTTMRTSSNSVETLFHIFCHGEEGKRNTRNERHFVLLLFFLAGNLGFPPPQVKERHMRKAPKNGT